MKQDEIKRRVNISFTALTHNCFTWATAEITDGKSNKGSRKTLNKEIDVKTLAAVKTCSLSR